LTSAELHAALALPESTRLHKRVFKKLFFENGDLRPADKRVLSEAVGNIMWSYTLKPTTVPIRPFRDEAREYDEIAVIDVEVTDRKTAARVGEVVHRTIPYPVLLVVYDAAGVSLSAAPKRLHVQDRSRVITEAIEATTWLDDTERSPIEMAFLSSLALPGLPQTDFFALYAAWVQRILALACAELSTQFAVPADLAYAERRAALDGCRAQERRIASLRATLRAETSFSRKVELNTEIKKLEAALRLQAAAI
jgi:hypothetical protein